MLEHESDATLPGLAIRLCPPVEVDLLPASANSRPAMIRSKVVLPEPDGPKQRDEPAGLDLETRPLSYAVNCAESLRHARELLMLISFSLVLLRAPLHDALDDQRC